MEDAGYSERLSKTGDNLALVAKYLYDNHRDIFQEIIESMQRRVPGVSKVETQETEDGRIILKFADGNFKDPFISRYVSDGTIKMFTYLVLLKDPQKHALLCIEEPENQLYPHLLSELAEEFRLYACEGGQVFISTHSPDFLNAVQLDELYCLVKGVDGYTKIFKASDSKLVCELYEAGDLLGQLWRQDLLIEREEVSCSRSNRQSHPHTNKIPEPTSVVQKVIDFLLLFIPTILAKRVVAILLLAADVPVPRVIELSGACDRTVRGLLRSLKKGEM